MLLLITYDVSTENSAGRKRLRKVAKVCVNYGTRVQNSVFECSLDPVELVVVRNKLLEIIDKDSDSLRIYNLGNNYRTKIEHYGAKQTQLPDDPIIF